MNMGMMTVGALLLVAGIFGYLYAQDQQGIVEQGEDAVTGEGQNWGLIQALSAASVVGGLILLVGGALADDDDDGYTDDNI